MIKQKKFKAFLKKQGCLRKFKANLKKDANGKRSFETYCKLIEKWELVSFAFRWDKTPEEYEFWKDIYELWGSEIYNK